MKSYMIINNSCMKSLDSTNVSKPSCNHSIKTNSSNSITRNYILFKIAHKFNLNKTPI